MTAAAAGAVPGRFRRVLVLPVAPWSAKVQDLVVGRVVMMVAFHDHDEMQPLKQ